MKHEALDNNGCGIKGLSGVKSHSKRPCPDRQSSDSTLSDTKWQALNCREWAYARKGWTLSSLDLVC